MIRLFLTSVAIWAVFAALIGGVQVISAQSGDGQGNATIAMLRESQYIDGHWCWRGLCLGQTTFEEAATRLRDKAVFGDLFNIQDQGTLSLVWEWREQPYWYDVLARARDDDRLSRHNVNIGDRSMTMADAIRLFGTPTTVFVQVIEVGFSVEVCFEREVCAQIAGWNAFLTPHSVITEIDFMTAEARQAQDVYASEPTAWRGFSNYTPRWWYRLNK